VKTRTMAELVRHQDPLAMPPGATVQEACLAMHRRRVGAVLVVEGTTLAGIFTGRDAVQCLARQLDPARTSLGQVMSRNPTTLGPKDHAIEALRLMNDGGFRHLPVVEQGRVLGIVSRYDFRSEEHGRMDEETGFFEVLR
jgi:CBS domain-containing protein